jgi:hypothetical protein
MPFCMLKHILKVVLAEFKICHVLVHDHEIFISPPPPKKLELKRLAWKNEGIEVRCKLYNKL